MKKQTGGPFHVYITEDTVRGAMLEKSRHPGLECIIQMPGIRKGNTFFFDLVADSGISATYQYAMCEKDHAYADHLATRLLEYYQFVPEEVTASLVHCHPPGYRRFSQGDGPANRKMARQFGGVVNGLMWVDPKFHMQFWYIDEEGRETPVEYTVDNEAVAAAMPRKSLDGLKNLVEEREARAAGRGKAPAAIQVQKRENIQERSVIEKRWYERLFPKKEEKYMDFEKICEAFRPYTALLPEAFQKERYEGPLHGYYIPETRTFNVVPRELAKKRGDVKEIGEAGASGHAFLDAPGEGPWLQITWKKGEPGAAVANDAEAEVNVDWYALQKEVFSRNTGILEPSQMSDKQAVILGLGSAGFFLGLELIKAGIGSLIAVDNDVFAYHNICRHVCGIHDVGRYKTDLFAQRAADVNPSCQVHTFRDLIQHVDPKAFKEALWEKSILICCADNRHAAYVANELADQYHLPMVDAGCGPRASTGEVFYYKPDSGMPCYTCAYGEDRGVDYSNQNVRRRFYATEAQLEKLHFQPGMSMDVELTAIFQAKLAIDLLMEQEPGYEPKLLPYVRQCTVLLNYPVSDEVNPYVQLFESGNSVPRPMSFKSGPAVKDPKCGFCGEK